MDRILIECYRKEYVFLLEDIHVDIERKRSYIKKVYAEIDLSKIDDDNKRKLDRIRKEEDFINRLEKLISIITAIQEQQYLIISTLEAENRYCQSLNETQAKQIERYVEEFVINEVKKC